MERTSHHGASVSIMRRSSGILRTTWILSWVFRELRKCYLCYPTADHPLIPMYKPSSPVNISISSVVPVNEWTTPELVVR